MKTFKEIRDSLNEGMNDNLSKTDAIEVERFLPSIERNLKSLLKVSVKLTKGTSLGSYKADLPNGYLGNIEEFLGKFGLLLNFRSSAGRVSIRAPIFLTNINFKNDIFLKREIGININDKNPITIYKK